MVEEDLKKRVNPALFKISYGLFIVGSVSNDKFNAQTCNTVFQITSDPPRVAVGLNRKNLTNEYVKDSGVLSICVLGQSALDIVRSFGFKSGREVDKFQGVEYTVGLTGAPIIKDCIAYLDCRVDAGLSVDVGTHTLFIADVVDGVLKEDVEPMTYAFFRQSKKKPAVIAEPETYNRWECKVCKFVARGSKPPYRCDQCGSPSDKFILIS